MVAADLGKPTKTTEGVSNRMKSCEPVMSSHGAAWQDINVSGGASVSPFFRTLYTRGP